VKSFTCVLRPHIVPMIRAGMTVPVLAVRACGGNSPNLALLASGPSPEFDGTALLHLKPKRRDKVQRSPAPTMPGRYVGTRALPIAGRWRKLYHMPIAGLAFQRLFPVFRNTAKLPDPSLVKALNT
jgi:hypothetical protein